MITEYLSTNLKEIVAFASGILVGIVIVILINKITRKFKKMKPVQKVEEPIMCTEPKVIKELEKIAKPTEPKVELYYDTPKEVKQITPLTGNEMTAKEVKKEMEVQNEKTN